MTKLHTIYLNSDFYKPWTKYLDVLFKKAFDYFVEDENIKKFNGGLKKLLNQTIFKNDD